MTRIKMSSQMNSEESSQISSYFKDKCIFITGATGFLGKVLVEKLLRSCSDLKSIYVMVRSKKGKPASDRLEEILNSHGVYNYKFFFV